MTLYDTTITCKLIRFILLQSIVAIIYLLDPAPCCMNTVHCTTINDYNSIEYNNQVCTIINLVLQSIEYNNQLSTTTSQTKAAQQMAMLQNFFEPPVLLNILIQLLFRHIQPNLCELLS